MTPILLPREEYLKQTVFHLVESRSGIARRQRSSNLVRRFASTISYSGATPPSRSGLRSEPRPSGSGLSIRHCNSEYEYLVRQHHAAGGGLGRMLAVGAHARDDGQRRQIEQ